MNEIKINNSNGTLTVSSLQIADDFSKQHKDVIKSIENLLGETSAKKSANLTAQISVIKNFFIESTYADSYGRPQKCYDITRDGFSLLVMGFTGKKALEWKIKYIAAFNAMETQLKNPTMINESLRQELNEFKACLSYMSDLYKEQSKRLEKLENAKALEHHKKFVPPTTEQVEDYCCDLGEYIDAYRFVDYYQSIGWLVGNKPMKDWKATVRNWIRSQRDD